MELRISGSAWVRIRRTTLAGISSTRSAASSTYSSSRTSRSSLSENPWISSCWASGSISTKVSAACSLGSSRNMTGICFSSSPSKSPATSLGFMVTRMSRREAYFFSSSIFSRAFSTISKRSAIVDLQYSKILAQSRVRCPPGCGRASTSAGYIAASAGIHGYPSLWFQIVRKASACHSEPVHTLAWESPGFSNIS